MITEYSIYFKKCIEITNLPIKNTFIAVVRLSRNISDFFIQGCFLTLITVLSLFGFYGNGYHPPTVQTRIELVEQVHVPVEAIPEFQAESIEFSEPLIPPTGLLSHQARQVRQTLKRTADRYTEAPTYHRKTTQSTSSEDEPLSFLLIA